MKNKIILSLATVAICLATSTRGEQISLASAPPVVVRTTPAAGATDVDPSLAEIRVTFSKQMQDGSWSWSTWGKENFPMMTGKPKYLADGRTCVLPVKLQPGKFYATWLNSDKFHDFMDASGCIAVPYLLTFRTREATDANAAKFDKVVEDTLKAPVRRVAELLDLDSGKRATSKTFGENDRETHRWVYDNGLDVMGVVEKGQIGVMCFDMAAIPTRSNTFDKITAAEILTNRNLNQQQPKPVVATSLLEDKTDTWLFLTRESGRGALQILGQTETPRGVKIRYKIVR